MKGIIKFAERLLIDPKKVAYQVTREGFRLLPEDLKIALDGPRHRFVRFMHGLPSLPIRGHRKFQATDLSWKEFRDRVLSKRNQYKGIFVQECCIDWNVPLYQRPQHMATALGRLGYLVIYRTDNWSGDDVNGFREVSPNVWITNRSEVEGIQGVVRSFYSTSYVHTPRSLTRNGKRGVLIYEYIDHIDPEISGDSHNVTRLLELKKFAFEGGADHIVASSKRLYDEAVELAGERKVLLVPNGVDVRHYRDLTNQDAVVPESLLDFRSRYKTIVGYFGAIAPWLWYEVIKELAISRPDFGFVFIGPDYYGGASKLPKQPNVLHLGPVSYKNLPAFARKFDVCFIPFKPGEIAKTTSPLKLFEYFALEKPVVVTSDMYECTAYPEVFSGSTATELSRAIDLAVEIRESQTFRSKLRLLADQNDWVERAHTMSPCFLGVES